MEILRPWHHKVLKKTWDVLQIDNRYCIFAALLSIFNHDQTHLPTLE